MEPDSEIERVQLDFGNVGFDGELRHPWQDSTPPGDEPQTDYERYGIVERAFASAAIDELRH